MLAVDLVELLRRFLVVLLIVEEIEALIIEPVGGAVGDVVVLRGAACKRKRHDKQGEHEPQRRREACRRAEA